MELFFSVDGGCQDRIKPWLIVNKIRNRVKVRGFASIGMLEFWNIGILESWVLG
jgi:hypothetical protein